MHFEQGQIEGSETFRSQNAAMLLVEALLELLRISRFPSGSLIIGYQPQRGFDDSNGSTKTGSTVLVVTKPAGSLRKSLILSEAVNNFNDCTHIFI